MKVEITKEFRVEETEGLDGSFLKCAKAEDNLQDSNSKPCHIPISEEWRDRPVRSRLGQLLVDPNLSDLTFIVGENEERIFAHKLILRSSSRILDILIQAHESSGLSEIKIPTVCPDMFRRLLKFIYTDELSINDFNQFLKVAQDLGFRNLPLQSIKVLNRMNLDSSNVFDLLGVAKDLQEKKLRQKCINFIQTNTTQVFASKEFLKISYEQLMDLVRELVVDEVSLFGAVMLWGRDQCEHSFLPSTAENVRIILSDIKYMLPYSSIEFVENDVKSAGIFTPNELQSILKALSNDITPSDSSQRQKDSDVLMTDEINTRLKTDPDSMDQNPTQGIFSFKPLVIKRKNAFETKSPSKQARCNLLPEGTNGKNTPFNTKASIMPFLVGQPNLLKPKLTEDANLLKNPIPVSTQILNSLNTKLSSSKKGKEVVVGKNAVLKRSIERNFKLPAKTSVKDSSIVLSSSSKAKTKIQEDTLTRYILKNCSIKFNFLCENVSARRDNIEHIYFHNVEIVCDDSDSSPPERVILPKLKSFVYFQEYEPKETPNLSFLCGMTMKEFLFFEIQSKRKWTYSDIYFLGVDILVQVNGVKYFDVSPSKAQILMTNPILPYSRDFMRSIIFQKTPLKKLCIYGGSLSDADQINGSELETLLLYNIDVEKQYAIRLANSSSKLKNLSIYLKDNLSVVHMSSEFLKSRKTLEKLSLTRTRIHGWTANNEEKSPCFSSLQELYLDQCFWDRNINYMCQKIPNLRRLTIRSIPECRPSCTMLKSILQLRTIKYISIIDYRLKSKLYFSSNTQIHKCLKDDDSCAIDNPILDIFEDFEFFAGLQQTQSSKADKEYVYLVLKDAGIPFPLNKTNPEKPSPSKYVVPDFAIKKDRDEWKSVGPLSPEDFEDIHFHCSLTTELFSSSKEFAYLENRV